MRDFQDVSFASVTFTPVANHLLDVGSLVKSGHLVGVQICSCVLQLFQVLWNSDRSPAFTIASSQLLVVVIVAWPLSL